MKTKHLLVLSIFYSCYGFAQNVQLGTTIPSGANNVGIGTYSLRANNNANSNTAVGYATLSNGYAATPSGTQDGPGNTAIGSQALRSNTTGEFNSAVGANALDGNTSGIRNVAMGYRALIFNTSGNYNIGLGSYSLYNNGAQSNNIGIGNTAGQNLVGNSNVILGNGVGTSLSGNNNMLFGNGAGNSLVGSNNLLLGNSAGMSLTGSGNVVFGSYSTTSTLSNHIIFCSGASSTVKMLINSTGDVGIATTAPTKKLDVNGEARIRTLPITSANTYFLSVDTDGNITKQLGTSAGSINIYNTSAFISGTGDRTVTLDGHNLIFDTAGGSDGKIYIGENVNNPAFTPINGLDDDYNLLVEKGILTERIKVSLRDNVNWADYVFAKDYELKSLSEVETFIKENGHLPGIEPASEILKNGLDLGAMQAKQMEKIEELTLYAIEQEKRIFSQAGQLQSQAEEIQKLKEQVQILLGQR